LTIPAWAYCPIQKDARADGSAAQGQSIQYRNSSVTTCEHRKPVNRDAAKILRRAKPWEIKSEWSKADEEAIRWDGLISKCPNCGDRAYENGHCFGCGLPLSRRDGLKKTEHETHENYEK
jgi:hypothetical protein